MSSGRGCLGEGRLGLPGQVWELRLGKIAVPNMSGEAPGSPRHPFSRHLRPYGHDNNLKVLILLSRHFVVIAQAPTGQASNLFALAVEIHCNVGHCARIIASATPRYGELS